MLRAICVSSANDAAVAVAELVGGTEEAFVARMNAKAAELGMADTTFKNACGLDTEGHLSTARGCGGDEPGHPERVPRGAALQRHLDRYAAGAARPCW